MSSFSKDKNTKRCVEEGKCLHGLQLILDGEASADEEAYFMKHLDECMPCYNLYKLDKAVKELLQTKIKKKNVPSALRTEIQKKITFLRENA